MYYSRHPGSSVREVGVGEASGVTLSAGAAGAASKQGIGSYLRVSLLKMPSILVGSQPASLPASPPASWVDNLPARPQNDAEGASE